MWPGLWGGGLWGGRGSLFSYAICYSLQVCFVVLVSFYKFASRAICYSLQVCATGFLQVWILEKLSLDFHSINGKVKLS